MHILKRTQRLRRRAIVIPLAAAAIAAPVAGTGLAIGSGTADAEQVVRCETDARLATGNLHPLGHWLSFDGFTSCSQPIVPASVAIPASAHRVAHRQPSAHAANTAVIGCPTAPGQTCTVLFSMLRGRAVASALFSNGEYANKIFWCFRRSCTQERAFAHPNSPFVRVDAVAITARGVVIWSAW
jgi:hypothetical protein